MATQKTGKVRLHGFRVMQVGRHTDRETDSPVRCTDGPDRQTTTDRQTNILITILCKVIMQ